MVAPASSSHCEQCLLSKAVPHAGLSHTSPQSSKVHRQDLHPKLQQGGQHRRAASCLHSSKLLPSVALRRAEDATKHLPLPSLISLEIPGASTCTGQAPESLFSCKQCLGGQQTSSKKLHNIPPNATWLGSTFLRPSSLPSLPKHPKAITVQAGRKP